MKSITHTQQTNILSLLDQGYSGHHISSATGVSNATISRICSKHHSTLSKSVEGQPPKLLPINIHYAVCFITSGKADTAVQAAKSLETILD